MHFYSNCSFIFDNYSINLCLGYQLFIICPLIPLYFSEKLQVLYLPNVWTLPSESFLPFCLVQEYSYLRGQGGDVTELVTDQETEFLNQVLRHISHYFQIRQVNIKSYRPSANGFVESKTHILINILKVIVSANPNVWTKAFPIATMAINSSLNRSLKDTCHFLVFAQDPRMPYGDLMSLQKPICNVDNYKHFLCSVKDESTRPCNICLRK